MTCWLWLWVTWKSKSYCYRLEKVQEERMNFELVIQSYMSCLLGEKMAPSFFDLVMDVDEKTLLEMYVWNERRTDVSN